MAYLDSNIAVTDSVFDSPAGSRKTSGAGIDASNIKPGMLVNFFFTNSTSVTKK